MAVVLEPGLRVSEDGVALTVTVGLAAVGLVGLVGLIGFVGFVPPEPGVTTVTEPNEKAE